MPHLSDQQPLVPPALRRFQAVKEQQTVHLKHNSPELCSKSDDYLTPSESAGSKLPTRRHPKSTVHGVVNQFGQLHEQKSRIDRLLSSVGNIFRRMCTQEVRTLRLLDDSQNVEVVDVCLDGSCAPSQESWSHMRGDRNSVDTVHTGNEGFSSVMIATFKEAISSQKIQNSASSKSFERVTLKSHDGSTPKSRETAKAKSYDGAPSEPHERATSEFPEKATPKFREKATSKFKNEASSKSHERTASEFPERPTSKSHDGASTKSCEAAAPHSCAHSHRRLRWTSASNKKQFEVSKHEAQQSIDVGEKHNSSYQTSNSAEVLWATPECSKLTQLPSSKHRKFNLSKIFRIKRNSTQRYSLPTHSPLGTEYDEPQALLCNPELDDNSFDSFDSKEDMALESSRLSFLRQSSFSSSDIPNQSQNNIILPGKKSSQVKSVPDKIRESADVTHSSAGGNFTFDMTGYGYVTRKSNIATTRETVQRSPSDSSLAKWEHLGDSTDDLTQLIYVAL